MFNKEFISSLPFIILEEHHRASGVEIEIEGIRYERARVICPRYWSVVNDNSLRNGVEFIFNRPHKPEIALIALNNLYNSFKDHGMHRFSASLRCGLHVHIDIRDKTAEQIVDIILTYLIVERCTFKYVGLNRHKNTYCRPLINSEFKSMFGDLLSYISADDDEEAMLQLNNFCEGTEKYGALNVRTIPSKGSLEFRLHQGIVDPRDALPWMDILHAIVRNANYKLLLSLYSTEGALAVFNVVFKNSILDPETGEIFGIPNIYENTDDLINDIGEGILDALEVLDYKRASSTTFTTDRVSNLKAFDTLVSNLNNLINI